MKTTTIFLVFFMVLMLLAGCDYYSDAYISVTHSEPDSMGVIEYQAGVSEKKNAVRIFVLHYELTSITGGQIQITFPERIKDEFGKEYPIDSFGGAIGTNAPCREFELIISAPEGVSPETPITLTIDVGALPLNTSDWSDIAIHFPSDATVTQVPLESVVFLSDEPLAYNLYLKEKNDKGSVSDARDTDIWYHLPDTEYLGGEKVIIQFKPPKEGRERVVTLGSVVLAPVIIQEAYVQYEFIMPYHSVTVMVTDAPD